MIRRVKGQSMFPFLKELDEVYTGEIDPFECSCGDIVIYNSEASEKCLAIHRVLSVDKKNKRFFIKGDNEPKEAIETVSFSSVKEKVYQIKRGKKLFDLNKFPGNVTKKIVAFASRMDLTPTRVKARFIDPTILAIADNKYYKKIRKIFYKDIFFSVSKNNGKYNVYGFISGFQIAKATLDRKNRQNVIVSSYIRRRDRNSFFAEKFLNKIIEVVYKEFGKEQIIHVTDPELKKLVASREKFYCDEKVLFTVH